MSKSNIQLVDECDRFPYPDDNPASYKAHLENYWEFKVNGCNAVLGHMLDAVVLRFNFPANDWFVDYKNRTLTMLTSPTATPAQRSAVIAKALELAVQQDTFSVLRGWRNELYPVYGPGGEFLLEMERAASPLFGIVSYGVHATAYTKDANGELRIWVPRRSQTKQTWPGMLDNSVAGGMSTGEMPFECLVREAMEEASLPEAIVRANAVPVGCVSYVYVRDSAAGGETDLVQPEVEYVFDIPLDAETIPKPCDSEVQEFNLFSIDECKAALANGEFKPNCSVVLLDFFIRHGILTAENEPDYSTILARVHRRLEFPTRHLCDVAACL
ncbi:thiamine pyrophosphokinase-related protein [Aspergillus heteromorphus CBS 117.55]|uniref:Thiamine pyrophosphokinase-related protein n=1 Tax=Aspergillus heteromorphus CBS 117.55 TaxID=1448321 RepID=A0A317WI52_9EURO|nr:thiamine pyrophosphokinase-related protein [Aspergillus heteromorphus CBS 117.55]PWY84847.1 thiamine pyrophosphokinase-related protein [Aspergillus heteromorphus CBS 117.55]